MFLRGSFDNQETVDTYLPSFASVSRSVLHASPEASVGRTDILGDVSLGPLELEKREERLERHEAEGQWRLRQQRGREAESDEAARRATAAAAGHDVERRTLEQRRLAALEVLHELADMQRLEQRRVAGTPMPMPPGTPHPLPSGASPPTTATAGAAAAVPSSGTRGGGGAASESAYASACPSPSATPPRTQSPPPLATHGAYSAHGAQGTHGGGRPGLEYPKHSIAGERTGLSAAYLVRVAAARRAEARSLAAMQFADGPVPAHAGSGVGPRPLAPADSPDGCADSISPETAMCAATRQPQPAGRQGTGGPGKSPSGDSPNYAEALPPGPSGGGAGSGGGAVAARAQMAPPWGFEPYAATVLPTPECRPPLPDSRPHPAGDECYAIGPVSLLRPEPLEVSRSQAVGAVGLERSPAAEDTAAELGHGATVRPTAFRSWERVAEIEAAGDDGQARVLPPDRPTVLSEMRRRPKSAASAPRTRGRRDGWLGATAGTRRGMPMSTGWRPSGAGPGR